MACKSPNEIDKCFDFCDMTYLRLGIFYFSDIYLSYICILGRKWIMHFWLCFKCDNNLHATERYKLENGLSLATSTFRFVSFFFLSKLKDKPLIIRMFEVIICLGLILV